LDRDGIKGELSFYHLCIFYFMHLIALSFM
jgi:hypothetical protein